MPFHCLTPGKQKPLKVKSFFPLKSVERIWTQQIIPAKSSANLKYDSAKHIPINITAKYSETNTANVMLLSKYTCNCFVLKQCTTANQITTLHSVSELRT